MSDIELRRLRFSDPVQEQDFQREYADRSLRHVRLMTLLVFCIVALYGLTQRDLPLEERNAYWTLRYGIMCPLLAGGLALTFWRGFKARMQPIMAFVMFVLGLNVVGAMSIAARFGSDHAFAPADLMIVLLSTYTLARIRFVWATLVCWVVLPLYFVSALHFGVKPTASLVQYGYELLFANLLGMSASLSLERYVRRDYLQTRSLAAQSREIAAERERAERLLLNILPSSIADRLKLDSSTIADQFADVTILFADIVNFTPLAERLSPPEVVQVLNGLFSAFDHLAEKHGIEKIKTIGDAYMLASGLPEARPDHAQAAARMALEMQEVTKRFGEEIDFPLALKIGINSGPVVAGVIGTRKFIYDLWGDAVNTASRMESHAPREGGIQVTEATYHLLCDEFDLVCRGPIEVKNKGEMCVYLLKGVCTSGNDTPLTEGKS